MLKKGLNTILILSIVFSGYFSVLPVQADVVTEKKIEILNQNQSLILVESVPVKTNLVVEQKVESRCTDFVINNTVKHLDNFWQNSSQSWLLGIPSACVELTVSEKQNALAKIAIVNNINKNYSNSVVVVKSKTTVEKKYNFEQHNRQNSLFVLINKTDETVKFIFGFFRLKLKHGSELLLNNSLLAELGLNKIQMEILRC